MVWLVATCQATRIWHHDSPMVVLRVRPVRRGTPCRAVRAISSAQLKEYHAIVRHRLLASEVDPPPEEVSQTRKAPGPTVPCRPDEVGTMSNLIPSFEELASIATALSNLMDTFEQYKLFLDNPSEPIGNFAPTIAMLATDSLCRTEMQGSFCRLERLLNPRRLPYGSPELAGILVHGWPPHVMTGLSVLKQHVDQLIQRWDIPEVCDDRTMMRGRYGITRDEGTIEEIDRPVQPCTLTTAEHDRLGWVLNAFVEALGKAIEAPGPAVINSVRHEICRYSLTSFPL